MAFYEYVALNNTVVSSPGSLGVLRVSMLFFFIKHGLQGHTLTGLKEHPSRSCRAKTPRFVFQAPA